MAGNHTANRRTIACTGAGGRAGFKWRVITAGLVMRDVRRHTHMSDSTIQIRDPWTMPYIEDADVFIDALHQQIGSEHPLFRREVFPMALRHDPDAVIYETDDMPQIYALVYLSWSGSAMQRTRRGNPKTEVLPDRQALQARIDSDYEEWVAQFR